MYLPTTSQVDWYAEEQARAAATRPSQWRTSLLDDGALAENTAAAGGAAAAAAVAALGRCPEYRQASALRGRGGGWNRQRANGGNGGGPRWVSWEGNQEQARFVGAPRVLEESRPVLGA